MSIGPLSDFPFSPELKLLNDWFLENWPPSREGPSPRLTFKLGSTDRKIGWAGTLSWSNGEISREQIIKVPAGLVSHPSLFEPAKASFLGDLRNAIEGDMKRWGVVKHERAEVLHGEGKQIVARLPE